MDNSAWHQFRARGCGSSDIASILGISPWKSAHQLWKEKTGLEKAVDISGQFQVQRGILNEPKARAIYELIEGKSFPAALAIHPKYDFMRVSLDGDDGETVLEIKCPSQKVMDEAKEKKVPDYYMCQIQYQMLCAQRGKAVFFCYQPSTDHYEMVDVYPDLELQAKIEKAVAEFWGKVQSKIWTDETDFFECNDEMFKYAADRWQIMKKNYEDAELLFEMAKSDVLEFAKKHKKEVRGFGIKILKSEVKGSVDYKKIPELKGVNLDAYRKASTTRTSIKALNDA